MTNASVNAFPGRQYDLVRQFDPTADAGLQPAILELFGALSLLIQPLGVNITVGCVDRELGMPDWDIPVSEPDWHLRGEDTPSWVFVETFAPPAQIRGVREIGTAQMGACMEEALRQPCPAPGTHRVSLFTLEVVAARVRMDERNPDGVQPGWMRLESDDGTFTVPQEIRDGARWVSGPIEPLPNDPPVHLQLTYEGGCLRMRISVRWSLWQEADAQGPTAFSQMLDRAVAIGWENS